jgi:hypothetical protein
MLAGPKRISQGMIGDLAFSQDARTLAVWYFHRGGGGGVDLLDLAQLKPMKSDGPPNIPEGFTRGIMTGSGGKLLAAGDDVGGKGVKLWDVDLESWKHLAGRVANRNLTRAEWEHYFPGQTYRKTFAELPEPPDVLSGNAASLRMSAGPSTRTPESSDERPVLPHPQP